eukprot:10445636-Heterocapsa_arctica.AAC.1
MDVLNLTKGVPAEIIATRSGLQGRITKVLAKDEISNVEAHGLVRAVMALGLAAQDFYEEQSGFGAACST